MFHLVFRDELNYSCLGGEKSRKNSDSPGEPSFSYVFFPEKGERYG
jgi:hypothetical protein